MQVICVRKKTEKQTNVDRSFKLNFKGFFLHFHYFYSAGLFP